MNPKINKDKAINALLFVASKTGGEIDIHRLSKILYFADQKHLIRYGRPITRDQYVPMDKGPVPSKVYDYFKAVRSNKETPLKNYCAEYFDVENWMHFIMKEQPNLEMLSESEIECLSESIIENKDLGHDELIFKSHDAAYEQARSHSHSRLSFLEMAKVAGASEEMLNYIQLKQENERAEL